MPLLTHLSITRPARWLVLFTAACLLSGCASLGMKEPPPVTVPQIIEMSQADVPATTIIERMREAGTVYRVQASELARLSDKGVPDAVVDYMQKTYLEAVRDNQALEDDDAWSNIDGWWYSRPFDPVY